MWLGIRALEMVVGFLKEPSRLRTSYGPQEDAWAAIVSLQGDLETDLQNQVVTRMEDKGLAGCVIARQKLRFHDPIGTGGRGEELEHIVFTQDLGNGGKAAFALRIARLGLEDMEISWHLFERNSRTELNRTAGPMAAAFVTLIVMGLLVSGSPGSLSDGSVLVGLFVMIVGLSLALALVFAGFRGAAQTSKGKRSVSTHQHRNALLFGKLVYQVLMLSLEDLGVQPHELQIVQQAQLIGK